MAADFQNFLRVLEGRLPGRPSELEMPLPRTFCQQIIWRAGEGVWDQPARCAMAYADACRWCGFDCAPVELDPSLDGPALEAVLPGGMKFLQVLPALSLGQKADRELSAAEAFLLAEIRRCCALDPVGGVVLREDWQGVSESHLRTQVLPAIQRLAAAAHEDKKPFLLECSRGCDRVMDQLIASGVDARGGFLDEEMPIETALERWWGQIPLFGGLDSRFLTANGPKTIQRRCRRLMEDTQNKGYFLGTTQIPGVEVEYLKRIAVLGAVQEA